jgi:uncharacterized caspase-like protein
MNATTAARIDRRRAIAQLMLLAAATLTPAADALARPSRVALVIGNAAYADAPLANPVADARAVARELEALGFSVKLVRDAGWKALNDVVREFSDQSQGARLRLVYYAGHGVQVRGRNYLVPVDVGMSPQARPKGESLSAQREGSPVNREGGGGAALDELTRRSIDLAELTERLARQPQAVNLFVIDACRNNPATQVALAADGRRLVARGPAPGLARQSAPAGSLIAYATAPGQVADDRGGGRNSLYTKHLLAHLATPGITVEQMFKRVRIAVLNESGNAQQPWEENSLTVDLCLRADAQNRCAGVPVQETPGLEKR